MSALQRIVTGLQSGTLVHVAFAFLVMGGWAMFANAGHPLDDALRAGAVQGVMSAAITLALKKALEALQRQASGLAALIAPPLIVCALSLAALVLAHVIAGTPEIARTIAVPFGIAFTYACIYNFGLWRARDDRG